MVLYLARSWQVTAEFEKIVGKNWSPRSLSRGTAMDSDSLRSLRLRLWFDGKADLGEGFLDLGIDLMFEGFRGHFEGILDGEGG